MYRSFVLFIFIHWYPFLLVKSSSSSFFDFDRNIFQASYYVNENFSIGAIFNLPSSYKCAYSQCLTNLKLILRKDNLLPMSLWCDSPAVLVKTKYRNMDELACLLNGINASVGSYPLSATVQVHTAGRLVPIFSAVFPNDPGANQEWIRKEIIVLNVSSDTTEQQTMKLSTIKRRKRQNINADGSVNNGDTSQIQTMSANDGTNGNQPIQLNTYTGTLNPGCTADLACDGSSSCPDYPKTDDQGRAICCFSLPQASNGITALSSVIYQNGVQNLQDFQVNVGDGQSFNAANDLSVFPDQVTPASQCNVVLPAGTSQSNSAIFRVTWTYNSNSADNNSPPPSATAVPDGTLPVNVLRVTSTSAFVQQAAQYNEWFVCPPAQDGQVSLLRSIALLTGNNVDYLRCIYVNNQGIPLQDPTTGQLLVFTSSKNDASDNPTITILPAVHTDCISIQFFPNAGATIDLNSILLSVTIAFQTVPSADMPSMTPQVSNLQGTSQIEIDITINISPGDGDNIDSQGQTPATAQCTRYQSAVPMSSYDSTIGKYTGTLDVSAQNAQSNILDSITVTGSPTVENPITMLLVDSQGNTLSPSYSLTSGATLQVGLTISISKIILQASALQDAAMDSTLAVDIAVCPVNTAPNDISTTVAGPAISSLQTDNQILDGGGSPDISYIAPVAPSPPPLQPFPPPPSSVSPDTAVNCQERTSSTLGTYPPDISGLTTSTKKPPKTPRIQPTIGSEIYATPPTPYQSLTVQTWPNHTCFDQISFSTNPFVYDILISTSDYTNSVDCLSPNSGCSINFASANQPAITLLFTAPACPSYFRILSPSNVQQFSYSMYDENGIQIQLPGAIDNQGTLLSSSDANPLVQLNQYLCGYSIILKLLTTNDNGPPMRVTIDAGACFRNFSAMTTTTLAPTLPPAAIPSSWSPQVPSSVPMPSNIQSVDFVPAVPLYPSPPAVQPSPSWDQAASVPLSTSSLIAPPVPLYCADNYQLTTLLFGSQCLSNVVTNDPSVVPDYMINPGNQGANFQSNLPVTITYQFSCVLYLKYICITGMASNVNKFSYLISDINQNNVGQGIVTRLTADQCTPRPLPTAEFANQVVITIDETTDGQPPRNIMIDIQGCFSSSPLSPAPAMIPSAPSPSDNMRAYPIPLSPSLPSPVPVATPLAPSEIASPASQPSSSAFQPWSPPTVPLAPTPVQTIVVSPILSFSPPPPFSPPFAFYPPPPSVVQPMLPSPAVASIPPPASQTPLPPVAPPSIPSQPLSSPSAQTILTSPAPLSVPLQSSPTSILIQPVSSLQQTPFSPFSPNEFTPESTVPSNTCPQVSLTSHPSVELIVFSDSTNVTSDLDPDVNGCNLISTGSTMTVLLRHGASATFSSIGVSSPNVNQIDVALFDELSNSPLIQSPQGTIRSSLGLNPTVQNLPINPAATLSVTFVNTIDGQPPRNVRLLVYACFPTVTEMGPSPVPSTSQTNTTNQQPYYPVNPPIQTYPNNQPYQYPSTGPTTVCIDPSQPAQVTSVANTMLPPEYYSSNRCVCICQAGIVIPTSSGVIQYYPPSRTINKRTVTEKYSEQPRQKRQNIVTKSKN